MLADEMMASEYAESGKLKPRVTLFPTQDGHAIPFRSLLEARWALTFELLHIDWVYEPCYFELPSGRYTPDFYLPSAGWLEIKPDFSKLKAVEHKLRQFTRHKNDLIPEGYSTAFYSISSSFPTFSFDQAGTRCMLIQWTDDGYIVRSKDYAIDLFVSADYSGLRNRSRELYVDYVDRICTFTKDAYFDGPFRVGDLTVLQLAEWVDGDKGAVFQPPASSTLPEGNA